MVRLPDSARSCTLDSGDPRHHPRKGRVFLPSVTRAGDLRPSAAKRGYTARWRKARAAFLRAHPLCRMCAETGRTTLATVVDHIVPHRGDSGLFWNRANWQGLCTPCHDGAKRSFEMVGVLRGCDVTGMPLDPNHRWRA